MKVLIICGSESDRKVADEAIKILEENKIPYGLRIASAHREPDKVREIVKNSDADVFIAIAGLSAALPGFIASIIDKPVIGVPVNVKLSGLDALLSTMQMPSGIPVATVSIDGGKNAAILAMEILALKDENIQKKLTKYRGFK